MKSDEKDEVMRKFVDNEYSVLVATTVIEVGVDVPNATVIVIENAERFGLSQLHQLRGRVGRGSSQSYCILISDKGSKTTRERLEVMCSTNNGFVIADEDENEVRATFSVTDSTVCRRCQLPVRLTQKP